MNWIRFNKRCSFMVMRAWIWVSSVQRYLGAEGGEQPCTLFPSLCHFPSLSQSHSLSLLHFFTSSSLFFSYQLATHPPPPFFFSLSLCLFSTPLPFWELSLCRCLGSKVQRDWLDSLQRCPGERHPHVVAAGTGRPLLSPGLHHGSELKCTVQNYKK